IASSRLDLPQPLGPTTPVSPGSTRNSAGSTKLLKPESLSFLISIAAVAPFAALPGPGRLQRGFQAGARAGGSPTGGLEPLAVEEERRRAGDRQLVRLGLRAFGDLPRFVGPGEALHRLV